MKLTIQNDKDSTIKFKVTAELDEKDLAKQKAKALKKLGEGVKVPGFRSGAAPDKLVEENIDQNRLKSEVANGCVDAAFGAMLKEFKLDLVGAPKLEIKKMVEGESMTIEFVGDMKPEITLPDFSKWKTDKKVKDLKLKLTDVKIEKKQIDETLAQLQENMSKAEEVERAAKDGDRVWLDFDGKDEAGEQIPGAKSTNYPLVLGSRSFIPGFEEEVLGLKVGDEKEFEVTFPKDYHSKSLQAKKVKFKIKINKIAKLVKPELNDEFANKIGGFKTLQELRDDVESGLIERESQSSKEELKDALAEKLGNEAKMETPEMLVEDNIQTGLQNARQQAEQNGKNFEDFIKESGFKDEAELIKKEARPQAERQVKISLALRKLAEVQKLEVSKEELQQYTMTLMQQYGNPEAQKQIMSEQEQARIEGRLLADKVLDYLVAQVS